MRWLVLLALLLGCVPGCGPAPPPPTGSRSPDQFMDELDLTDAQRRELRELRNLPPEERPARLKQVLSPEQYARFEKRRNEGQERARARREKFARELGLTPDQQERVRVAMEDLVNETRTMTLEARRIRMRERLQAILTPAQLDKLEQLDVGPEP